MGTRYMTKLQGSCVWGFYVTIQVLSANSTSPLLSDLYINSQTDTSNIVFVVAKNTVLLWVPDMNGSTIDMINIDRQLILSFCINCIKKKLEIHIFFTLESYFNFKVNFLVLHM